MIWVVIGLLAVAIFAAFLYLGTLRPRRFQRHGSVAVPGESVIELPAGEIVVYYQDSFRWRYSERPEPWSGFSVLISDEQGGERIDLGPPPSETVYKSGGKNRIPYGSLRLPRAGRYRVASQIDADASEPRITFG